MKILTENNVVVSYQIVGGGYTPNENQVVYEVDDIPIEVQNASIQEYCYTEEQGFYLNPAIDRLTPLIETKVQELSNTCSNTIYQGIPITLSNGSTQHFTLTEQDQLNLSGIGLKLLMGAQQIAWHEDDVTKECQYYSAEDAQKIIATLTTFKEYHITYFRDLRIYVYSLNTVEEVEAIEYGFELPEEFKSRVLKDYEQLLKGE